MRRLCLAGSAVLMAVWACQIEDRTPTGTRRDEAAIEEVLTAYHQRLSTGDRAAVRELFWPNAIYSVGRIARLDSVLPRLLVAATPDGGSPNEVRMVRVDLRQEGDLAAAWVALRRQAPGTSAPQSDWMEHFVLRRGSGGWRIASIALAPGPGRGRRAP